MSDIRQAVWPAAQPVLGIKAFIHRIWPQAVVGLALSATTVWTSFLGYWFVRLIWQMI
jgi:hypothetical protein